MVGLKGEVATRVRTQKGGGLEIRENIFLGKWSRRVQEGVASKGDLILKKEGKGREAGEEKRVVGESTNARKGGTFVQLT